MCELLSHSDCFSTPWTVARLAPLSMEFSKQEYRSRLPFSSLGDLSHPRIEPMSLVSPEMAGRFFATGPTMGEAHELLYLLVNVYH